VKNPDETSHWAIRSSLQSLLGWYFRIRSQHRGEDVPEIGAAEVEQAERDRRGVSADERVAAVRAAREAVTQVQRRMKLTPEEERPRSDRKC